VGDGINPEPLPYFGIETYRELLMTIERVRAKGLVWVTQIENLFSEILIATRSQWTGLGIDARPRTCEMAIGIGSREICTQNTSHRMFRPLVYGNCQSVIG